MSPDLDKKLCEDFPLLYRDRHAPMFQTCMCWGFPGDGWEPLIRRLSEKLEPLIAACPDDPDYGRPTAMQVKEKYGTLRFYMTGETPQMSTHIHNAEHESSVTCETCGKPGTLTGSGWLRTACPEHAND